jgi:hypothetical protein
MQSVVQHCESQSSGNSMHSAMQKRRANTEHQIRNFIAGSSNVQQMNVHETSASTGQTCTKRCSQSSGVAAAC